jgi:hypothetical protein
MISAGAPTRIGNLEVPIPFVIIKGIFAELYASPVMKRLP